MVVPDLDVLAYLASLTLIGGYHLYLRLKLSRDRSYTIQSINNTARTAWVDNIMSDKSKGILGVQTLRNATMAATFLASTAILMSMGVTNLIKKVGGEDSVLHSIQTSLTTGDHFANLKLLLLLITFFGAFFCFSMAVRYYNHVGFLLNSTNPRLNFSPSPRYVSKLLNRSGRFYSYGMRAYYISVPMIFSLFNTYYMTIASVALVALLYKIDRAPKDEIVSDAVHTASKGRVGANSLFHFRGQKKPAVATPIKNHQKQDNEATDFSDAPPSGNVSGGN